MGVSVGGCEGRDGGLGGGQEPVCFIARQGLDAALHHADLVVVGQVRGLDDVVVVGPELTETGGQVREVGENVRKTLTLEEGAGG